MPRIMHLSFSRARVKFIVHTQLVHGAMSALEDDDNLVHIQPTILWVKEESARISQAAADKADGLTLKAAQYVLEFVSEARHSLEKLEEDPTPTLEQSQAYLVNFSIQLLTDTQTKVYAAELDSLLDALYSAEDAMDESDNNQIREDADDFTALVKTLISNGFKEASGVLRGKIKPPKRQKRRSKKDAK